MLNGRLIVPMSEVEVGPGERFVEPVGIEPQPFAAEEAALLLIEPSETPKTGDAAMATAHVTI
ncbi:MAG: hypothetical protein ACI88C_000878 [Acidimicrobiales bacterium]